MASLLRRMQNSSLTSVTGTVIPTIGRVLGRFKHRLVRAKDNFIGTLRPSDDLVLKIICSERRRRNE